MKRVPEKTEYRRIAGDAQKDGKQNIGGGACDHLNQEKHIIGQRKPRERIDGDPHDQRAEHVRQDVSELIGKAVLQ